MNITWWRIETVEYGAGKLRTSRCFLYSHCNLITTRLLVRNQRNLVQDYLAPHGQLKEQTFPSPEPNVPLSRQGLGTTIRERRLYQQTCSQVVAHSVKSELFSCPVCFRFQILSYRLQPFVIPDVRCLGL